MVSTLKYFYVFYTIYNITLEFEITRTYMTYIVCTLGYYYYTRESGVRFSAFSSFKYYTNELAYCLSYPTGNCDYCSAMFEMGFHHNVKIAESFVFKIPTHYNIIHLGT